MVIPFRQVAASVCIPSLKLDKLVRRHLRLAHIAPADTVSDNQQFPRYACRQEIPVTVDHHHLDIRHRLTNSNLIPRHLVKGTADGSLCRAIPIEHQSLRPKSLNLIVKSLWKCLCANVEHLNLRQRFIHLRQVNNIYQIRRRAGQHIHPIIKNQFRKSHRVMDFLLICHADRNPMVQRVTFLQNGNVKGNGRKCQRYGGIIYIRLSLHVIRVVIHIIHQIPMLNHDSLWLPGRTGSVNTVTQILRPNIHSRVSGFSTLGQKLLNEQCSDRKLIQKHLTLFGQTLRHQQELSLGILQYITDSLVRVFRVNGKKCASRLHDTLSCGVDLHRPRQHNADHLLYFKPHIDQAVRNLVGILVQLSKGQGASAGNYSRLVRIQSRLPLKQYICRRLLHSIIRLIISVNLPARLSAHHGDLLQQLLLSELIRHSGKTVHKSQYRPLLIHVASILCLIHNLSILHQHVNGQRRLCSIQGNLLTNSLFSCNLIKQEIVSLEGKHEVSLDIVSSADFRKGIDIRVHTVH